MEGLVEWYHPCNNSEEFIDEAGDGFMPVHLDIIIVNGTFRRVAAAVHVDCECCVYI